MQEQNLFPHHFSIKVITCVVKTVTVFAATTDHWLFCY